MMVGRNVIDGKDGSGSDSGHEGPKMVTTDPESLKKSGVVETV
jgi:hypothetical protein